LRIWGVVDPRREEIRGENAQGITQSTKMNKCKNMPNK
jgi:hypothetical protein